MRLRLSVISDTGKPLETVEVPASRDLSVLDLINKIIPQWDAMIHNLYVQNEQGQYESRKE